jgi:hypothetical protein
VTQEPPPGAVVPPPAQTPERRAFHIFINYRREDTAGHAGRLYDALAARFGDDHVFIDIDAIDPGEDFTQVVEQSVGSCDVLLALIGRGWTNTVDREGRRRLDKPDDWVRVEIQTALERPDTRVIPTLVQGAEMPSSDELPPPLQKLSHRKAFEIREQPLALRRAAPDRRPRGHSVRGCLAELHAKGERGTRNRCQRRDDADDECPELTRPELGEDFAERLIC